MAAGIGVDLEELRQKVFEGVSVEQLINELDQPDSKALSQALLHLLRDEVESETKEVAEAIGKKYAVNPKYEKEGIIIRPKMLKETAFKEGDEFKLRTEGDRRIVLTRIAVESVGPL